VCVTGFESVTPRRVNLATTRRKNDASLLDCALLRRRELGLKLIGDWFAAPK
jgi:hypothetical protein